MSYIAQILAVAPMLTRSGTKGERFSLQNSAHTTLPTGHRARACLRHLLGGSAVTVNKTARGNTRFGGIMICGAHHVCPICHYNKMTQERTIVSDIVRKHYENGGILVDAVFTTHHHAGDTFDSACERLEAVWKCFRSKRIWNELGDALGVVGCIRRLEITVGKNGWHPHYHVSFLCDPIAAKEIKGRTWRTALEDAFTIVVGAWSDASKRAGITTNEQAQIATAIIGHVNAQKAVEYNTKNMGYGERKKDSLTPMDLLRIINQIDDAAAVYAAKRLFCEYAEGIKGKHSLTFIGSARAARPAAVEHAAIANEDATVEQLGKVSPPAWKAILKHGLRELLADVNTRCELVAIVRHAASLGGHKSIPPDWLYLTQEKETVRGSSKSLSTCADGSPCV